MSISPRNRLIITIAAAAFIVIALIAVLVYPQFSQLALLNNQVVEASAATIFLLLTQMEVLAGREPERAMLFVPTTVGTAASAGGAGVLGSPLMPAE